MSLQITSAQYTTANQYIRNLHVQINLLDFNFLTVNSLEGNLIDGNINIDAKSNIRRTCSLSFVITNSSFNVEAGGQIWLDKYIQIRVGVDDIRTQEIAWNNIGIFLINEPTYTYDASNKTLSFQGVDLMAKLTGARNGYITGISSDSYTLIPTGSNVREAIIGVLQECGFDRYVVSECINVDGVIQDVPYEMQFEQGATWFEVLEALRDILPNYQIYFDINGVFHYEPIPSGENDPIVIDEDMWNGNRIGEVVNVNFSDVKNVVEIWGRVHEIENYSDSSTTTIIAGASAGQMIIVPTWTATIEQTQPEDYEMFALSLPDDVTASSSLMIRFGSVPTDYVIQNFSNQNITTLPKDEYLAFYYDGTENVFRYLGGAQAHAIYKDENPDSPFYVGGTIGEIPIVLSDDDYENIVSDDLALERAKFEIYNRCRLNDTITVTTIPIHWADVNIKVSYTPLSGDQTSKEYMVKSVNIPLSVTGTQSWNLSRFYPFYPII